MGLSFAETALRMVFETDRILRVVQLKIECHKLGRQKVKLFLYRVFQYGKINTAILCDRSG